MPNIKIQIGRTDLYFDNPTLFSQVNDATNITLTAGGNPASFTKSGAQLTVTDVLRSPPGLKPKCDLKCFFEIFFIEGRAVFSSFLAHNSGR